MQQSPSSSFIYLSSPSFHFSSCPYSYESFHQSSQSYLPPCSIYQPDVSSTSTHSPFPSLTKYSHSKDRARIESNNRSPSLCSALKRISDEAIEHLNAFYAMNKRPTHVEKDRLAVECNITLTQVNTWFNNARSRRGDTRTKLTQKLLRQQIDSLSNQIVHLQQQQLYSF